MYAADLVMPVGVLAEAMVVIDGLEHRVAAMQAHAL
jgi:hypothetical protein